MPMIVHALRRRWGVAFARANAQLLLDRFAFIGRGAHAAAERSVDAGHLRPMPPDDDTCYAGPLLGRGAAYAATLRWTRSCFE